MTENRLEPILYFEKESQLYISLKEWQDRLFLNDWVIKASLVDEVIDKETGEKLLGNNTFVIENKACHIRIARPNEDNTSRIVKYCAEVTLVHELLHCKYNWCQAPNTYEGIYCDTLEHSLIEQMAKSLIMAKYNLPFSWFENF